MTTVLEVHNLSISYNGIRALDKVSLSVAAGQRVAIVGPNGAGKSTLFRAMVGLIPIQAGSIHTFGAAVGYVTQRSVVDWGFPVTVHDVVMMGRVGKMGWLRWQRPVDREVVQGCLEQVGMVAYADRQIGELSGGQQQRVFIARALAQEANILLMDEPFSGVDASAQETILEILARLHQQGVTMLVSTHDLNLAAGACSRLLLLHQGGQAALDAPERVLTRELIRSVYGVEPILTRHPESGRPQVMLPADPAG